MELLDLVVRSATAIDAGGARPGSWVAVEAGRIVGAGTGEGWREHSRGAEVVDASGLALVPGFTDLHVHGGGGHANEGGADAILAGTGAHRRHGTTRTVVSLVSDDVDVLAGRLAGVADLVEEHPHVLGSHLEGPFLAHERRGAHDSAALVDPSPAAVEHLVSAARGTLRQVTLDPLREGAAQAAQAARAFRAAGAVVAVGHTEADHDQAASAFADGARLLTHAFNAMPGIGHRAPGPVVAAIEDADVVLELILDGEHVDVGVARLLFAAAPGRVALVTDAMAAAAGHDGRYRLGSVEVVVEGGRATLVGGSSLAGSTLTLDRALRVGAAAGLGVGSLVEAMTLTPARVLGLAGRCGLLEPGHVGDLVLLDDGLEVVDVRASGLRVV